MGESRRPTATPVDRRPRRRSGSGTARQGWAFGALLAACHIRAHRTPAGALVC